MGAVCTADVVFPTRARHRLADRVRAHMFLEVDVSGSPPFVLVHNPDRIPLSVNDGQPVDVAPRSPRGDLPAPLSKEVRFSSIGPEGGGEMWIGDVRGRAGWIRLFANLGDPKRLRRQALLDPPVSTLPLTGAQP